MQNTRPDVHSFSNPDQVRMKNLALDLEVLFDEKTLKGSATLEIERKVDGVASLVLDTRDLSVSRVETSADGNSYSSTNYKLGTADRILGTPLEIVLPGGAKWVRVHYSTSPNATALQWLSPAQTAGKQQPFLFTQSQAIHARSWIPLQDTPSVRIPYRARVRTPKNLLALMSAENDPKVAVTGDYSFTMPQPIPSYLIALAVGDLVFRPLGPRTGVYAEKPVIDRAAKEFEDTEKMLQTTEELYGPYRWGRYDLLVLPPSFPFGGMENPRLTFATPTILAGDKSLVALVAHELAHSWSGNLVTNATWSDFWLNEGFTVYVERRIIEKVYGPERAAMEAVIGRRELAKELDKLPARDQVLHIDLKGRDPDDGFTQVPYEKGALMLRTIEEAFWRPRFDAFLRSYFDHFQFTSITTDVFADYLQKNLFNQETGAAARVRLNDWLTQPAIPQGAAEPQSDALSAVEGHAKTWLDGGGLPPKTVTSRWSTHEWLHFIESLPRDIGKPKMAELDRAHSLTKTGNYEILSQWLVLAVGNNYEPAYPRMEEFLLTVGRRKYLKPLYEELIKTPEGKARAKAIYQKARPGYHPITAATIDGILKG